MVGAVAGLDPLAQGREAYSRRQWRQAFDLLSAAERESALAPEDLVRLGDAAYLVGDESEAVGAWTRAHTGFVEQADTLRAARVGFWLSLCLMLAGKGAQSGGWLSRCQRLISDRACAEQGLLQVLGGLFSMYKGDAAGALDAFQEATSLAVQFGDADLLAASVLGRGQALIQMQRADEGVVLLDEAMVAVTSGQVSPIMAGIIYCAVILTCERAFDRRRAQEWTVALDEWCRAQSELVAYRGQCLVHRSEVMLFKGDWVAARTEAKRAYALLSERSEQLAGRALYQQAELHRLAGELSQADECYREAGGRGFEPQPGASLLRLAQGDAKAAAASIRRVDSAAGSQQGPGAGVQRVRILEPFVEIMLAADDVESARSAAEELSRIACQRDVPYLKAGAAQATGAVRLASGDPDGALFSLREAWTLWQQLEAPFESARTRVLIARACEQVGDAGTAKLHLEAAVAAFERLGAMVELSRLRGGAGENGPAAQLSVRERQVLGLVATGKTNRQIASQLGISEHTVARHVSGIFNKIGVSSRTAAGAFAFEHGLV
jgi:DNA-binding CsgD family transcriptional regulator